MTLIPEAEGCYPHLVECNYWMKPIGHPGCVCVVVNRNELRKDRERLMDVLEAFATKPRGIPQATMAAGLLEELHAAFAASTKGNITNP